MTKIEHTPLQNIGLNKSDFNYSMHKDDIKAIIKAVNCHDEFISALKLAKSYMVMNTNNKANDGSVFGRDLGIIEKALAKAEER